MVIFSLDSVIIEEPGKSNNVSSAVNYVQSLLFGEGRRANENKSAKKKKLQLARCVELRVRASQTQSFRAARGHRVFSFADFFLLTRRTWLEGRDC